MYLDFKKICWERVHLPDDMTKDEIKQLIKDNTPGTLNYLLTDTKGCEWENIMDTDHYIDIDTETLND